MRVCCLRVVSVLKRLLPIRIVGMKRRLPDDSSSSKAQRAMSLRRSLPHMSASAFTQFVKMTKQTDLSELPDNRRALQHARDISLKDTPYGSMFVKLRLTGEPPYANRDMLMINPFALLHTACEQGGAYTSLLRQKLNENPSTPAAPWSLCLYSHGVAPGNQSSARNTRKVWVI